MSVLMPLPKIFCHDGFRRNPEYRTPELILPHANAIPTRADQPALNQLLSAIGQIRLATPRQEIKEDNAHMPVAQANNKEESPEEVPERVRKEWKNTLGGLVRQSELYGRARAEDQPKSTPICFRDFLIIGH